MNILCFLINHLNEYTECEAILIKKTNPYLNYPLSLKARRGLLKGLFHACFLTSLCHH